jgi:hypothetical protein
MLDAVDALDDLFQRFARQFHAVGRRKPRRGDANVDHRHLDLRLFLAGMVMVAINPTRMAASRNSGVSGDAMVARVMRPEMPRFIRPLRPARRQR